MNQRKEQQQLLMVTISDAHQIRSIAPRESIMDTFACTVIDYNDDELVSNKATVIIVITCERGEVKANPDEYVTNEDESIVTGPLDNDEDQENDPLQTSTESDHGECLCLIYFAKYYYKN